MKVSPSDAADVKNGVGIKDIHPDSDSTIFYTSGTTGYPKAVLSSQRASLHNVISSQIREQLAVWMNRSNLYSSWPSRPSCRRPT